MHKAFQSSYRVGLMLVHLSISTLLISGCGQKSQGPNSSDPTATSEGNSSESKQAVNIWWARFEPAAGLLRMCEQYTTETGIDIKLTQIPWPSFQTEVFLEFGKDQTYFDIVVGDSQWLGKAATSGWYLELTDWLQTVVDLADIHPVAGKYLCQYPPASGKYWAAPCESDAMGMAYRKDWFEDPTEREAFREKYGRELEVPKTWEELRDIAEFFQRPSEPRYGMSIPTDRSYDGLTMSYQQMMWAFGGQWGDPDTFQVQGLLNGDSSVKALEFFKELCRLGPPNAHNCTYPQVLESFTGGLTAMIIHYFAWFPKVVNDMGDKAGFAALPTKGGISVNSLGGQGFSISSKTSKERQALAKDFIAWFLKRENQERWVSIPSCFTADVSLLGSEEFRQATPYNAAFAESLGNCRDFWNVPQYGELLASSQRYLSEAMDGEMEPKEALDALAAEHKKIFQRADVQ